jgi:hypothetical protein
MWLWEGPFARGKEISLGDITMAPWFDRLAILEHFIGFKIPVNKVFERWHIWVKAVLEHPVVKPVRIPKEKLIEHYTQYFDRTARDKYYMKYYRNYDLEQLERYRPYDPADLSDGKGIDYVHELDKWGV